MGSFPSGSITSFVGIFASPEVADGAPFGASRRVPPRLLTGF